MSKKETYTLTMTLPLPVNVRLQIAGTREDPTVIAFDNAVMCFTLRDIIESLDGGLDGLAALEDLFPKSSPKE